MKINNEINKKYINKGYSYFSVFENKNIIFKIPRKKYNEVNFLILNNGNKYWIINQTFLKTNKKSYLFRKIL